MFSNNSINITKSIGIKEKKKFGIFFTPKSIRDILFNECKKILPNKKLNILEPSVGGCDFIDDIINLNLQYNHITAIELNHNIYNQIKDCYKQENISIINEDFLLFDNDMKYDFSPGNPPYFLLNKEQKNLYMSTVPNEHKKLFGGKPNIYCLFLYKVLLSLNNNGVLAHVIPSTLLNTTSYDAFRRYISSNYQIINIIPTKDYADFIDTKQDTIIIILQKTNNINNDKFTIEHNNCLFFSYEKEYFKKCIYNKTFIQNIKEINIKTGNIVWNQNKDLLTTDNQQSLLIYDFNISKNNELKLYKEEGLYNKKGQFIKLNSDNMFSPPAILVVRGNGNGNFNIRCTKINNDFEYKKFYAENHIYVITYTGTNKKEEEDYLNEIFQSLTNNDIKNFLTRSIPNKCLTKSDIEKLLPLSIKYKKNIKKVKIKKILKKNIKV
jgi:adenine-specific DNA-methyltransferase